MLSRTSTHIAHIYTEKENPMAKPYRSIAELNAQKAKLEKQGVNFDKQTQDLGKGGSIILSHNVDSSTWK